MAAIVVSAVHEDGVQCVGGRRGLTLLEELLQSQVLRKLVPADHVRACMYMSRNMDKKG